MHDVKHMSPRVLRQGGVSREDEGEEEEREKESGNRGEERLTLTNKGSKKILPEGLRFYPELFAFEEHF